MIDWYGLFYNALWILGMAVALGAFAMASFQTRVQGVRLRQVLGASSFLLPFGAGMCLFCGGVLLSSHTLWERVLWGLLAVLFAGQVFWMWRGRVGEGTEGGHKTSMPGHADRPAKTTLEERGS
jgi:uncharacterized membrane protein YgdD (TMEM256/DUF423 family)